jgi:hypothetical protein
MDAVKTGQMQRGRPFPPGQSGNPSGRPKGAKNRLTELFLSVIVADFAEHGADAIARLRTDDPATYLRLVGALVPRELILQREQEPDINYAELSFEELATVIEIERRRKFVKAALESV